MILANESISKFFKTNKYEIIMSFVVLAIITVICLLINLIIRQKIKSSSSLMTQVKNSIQTIIIYVSIFLWLIIVLSIWGCNVTPIIIIVAVILFLIIIVFRDLIFDYITGLKLILSKNIDVDQWIEVDGFRGVVKEVKYFYTTVVNANGETKYIPNSKIKDFVNLSIYPNTCNIDVQLPRGIHYDEVIDSLNNYLLSNNEKNAKIVEGPYVLGVQDYNENTITIRVVIKTQVENITTVERHVKKQILEFIDNYLKEK